MIEILCEGHDAAYELGNVRNLFLPYVKEELILETIYDGKVAKAILKKADEPLESATILQEAIGKDLKSN